MPPIPPSPLPSTPPSSSPLDKEPAGGPSSAAAPPRRGPTEQLLGIIDEVGSGGRHSGEESPAEVARGWPPAGGGLLDVVTSRSDPIGAIAGGSAGGVAVAAAATVTATADATDDATADATADAAAYATSVERG